MRQQGPHWCHRRRRRRRRDWPRADHRSHRGPHLLLQEEERWLVWGSRRRADEWDGGGDAGGDGGGDACGDGGGDACGRWKGSDSLKHTASQRSEPEMGLNPGGTHRREKPHSCSPFRMFPATRTRTHTLARMFARFSFHVSLFALLAFSWTHVVVAWPTIICRPVPSQTWRGVNRACVRFFSPTETCQSACW